MLVQNKQWLSWLAIGALWIGLTSGTTTGWAATRSINLEVNGQIYCITTQDDGKLLIGGDFKLVNGAVRQNIARLNADGTVDTNFVCGADKLVRKIAVSGTNIFACGIFTNIGGLSRPYLAKLNATDGSADPNWNCSDAGNALALVGGSGVLAADATGLYIGGEFTNMGGHARIARVTLVDGSVDPTFTNTVSGNGDYCYVTDLALKDNSLYLGGYFTNVDGQARCSIAKITSGILDSVFTSGLSEYDNIQRMLLNGADLYVGGYFSSIAGYAVTNLAKISALDGAPDTAWNNSGAYNNIASMAVSGANLYVSWWNNIGGVWGSYLAKLNTANGDVVSEFSPNIDALPAAIIMAGTDLIIGGLFTTVNGMTAYGMARLNPTTGALTQNMNIRRAGKANVFVKQQDSKIIMAGSFYYVNGEPRRCLARLNANWSLDSSFTNGVGDSANDSVYTLALNGTNLYVGGWFTNAAGQPRKNLAKFNTGDGSLDPRWTNEFNGNVYAMAADGDNLFMAGYFWKSNDWGNMQNLVRINTQDGTINSSFTNTAQNGWIQSLLVKDSSLYIGGYFTNVDGQPRSSIAKINLTSTSGTLDSVFTNGISVSTNEAVNYDYIACMLLDGSDLYIGGDFTSVAGHGVTNLAKLSAIDGSPYPAWNNHGANNSVYTLALSGMNLYVGGSFNNIGGVARSFLAKLNTANGAVDTAFNNGGADNGLSAIFVHENNMNLSVRAGLSSKDASLDPVLFLGGDFTRMGSTLAIGCAILGDIDAPPEITTQPQSLSKLPGENAAFSLTAASGLTMYYRWQKDGTALTDGGRLSGAATTNLAITTLQADDAGGYQCVVSNLIGAVTSSVATLTVTTIPSAPAQVSASDGLYADRVLVTWTAVSNATGYTVWRDTADASASADLLATTIVTNYSDTSALPGVPYWYWVKATNAAGSSAFSSSDIGYIIAPVTGDIDGDRLADLISVVGPDWYVWFSTSGYQVLCGPYDLGVSGTPVTGDIDGDRLADLIVVVGSNWYVWFSTSQYSTRCGPYNLGISGTPATGDIDGDGKADLISIVGSDWYVWLSSSGYTQRIGPINMGVSGTPVTGDIDGDRLADLISVVGSNWYVWFSSSGYTQRIGPIDFGISGTPATGDIDGDRLADLITVVGTNWYVWFSTSQYQVRCGPYTLSAP